jgi:23S rRNA pseudouridine2605 synthase
MSKSRKNVTNDERQKRKSKTDVSARKTRSGSARTLTKRSGDSRSEEKHSDATRFGGKRSGATRSGEKRSGETRSGVTRSSETRFGGKRSGETRSGGKRSGETRSGEKRSGETRSGVTRSSETRFGGKRSGETRSGGKRSGETRFGEKRSGETRSGVTRSSETRFGEKRSGETRFGEKRSGETRFGEKRSGETRSGVTRSSETRFGGKRSGETRSGEKRSGETRFGGKRSGETRFGGKRSGETRFGEKRSGETRFGGKRSGETRFGGKRSGETRFGGKRSGETRFGEKRSGETRFGEKRSGETRFGEKRSGAQHFGNEDENRDRRRSFSADSRQKGKQAYPARTRRSADGPSEGGQDRRRPIREATAQAGSIHAGDRAGKDAAKRHGRPAGTTGKSVTERKAHTRLSGARTGRLRRHSTSLREEQGLIRLNKFLAEAGVMSRRKADELILSGVVRVNGVVVKELGSKVHAGKDNVSVRGTPVHIQQQLVYILLNKPKDCITSTDDEKGRRTVMDIVPPAPRIFPVGRLDRNTTGAILLTNDGDLANRLTHPSFHASKTYVVEVTQRVQSHDIDKLRRGIRLDDGMTSPCEIEILDAPECRHLGIVLHEGRNRQIRRMFEAQGYSVRKLDRIAFANLTLEGLRRGTWRYLEEDEVRGLKKLLRKR